MIQLGRASSCRDATEPRPGYPAGGAVSLRKATLKDGVLGRPQSFLWFLHLRHGCARSLVIGIGVHFPTAMMEYEEEPWLGTSSRSGLETTTRERRALYRVQIEYQDRRGRRSL